MTRRRLLLSAAASALAAPALWPTVARAATPPLQRAPRLKPGDTVALVAPSSALYEREPLNLAVEAVRAMGFQVREMPNLRARYGPYAGTDAQRAADINAAFADPNIHGILCLRGGSGVGRMLPLLDYARIARTPKVICGYSDVTALLSALQVQTGLVTFHGPMGTSEWNAFNWQGFRGAVMEAQPLLLANAVDAGDSLVPRSGRTRTLRGGRAEGRLLGGNLAVLSALAGSRYFPDFTGAVLCLEEVNEALYRVDRMLSTLKLAGALDRLAGVVLGGFTNCGPGDGHYGALTLEEIFDDYFGGLKIPVYSGAQFGHVRRQFTLPIGLPVQIDADAGTLRYTQAAVT